MEEPIAWLLPWLFSQIEDIAPPSKDLPSRSKAHIETFFGWSDEILDFLMRHACVSPNEEPPVMDSTYAQVLCLIHRDPDTQILFKRIIRKCILLKGAMTYGNVAVWYTEDSMYDAFSILEDGFSLHLEESATYIFAYRRAWYIGKTMKTLETRVHEDHGPLFLKTLVQLGNMKPGQEGSKPLYTHNARNPDERKVGTLATTTAHKECPEAHDFLSTTLEGLQTIMFGTHPGLPTKHAHTAKFASDARPISMPELPWSKPNMGLNIQFPLLYPTVLSKWTVEMDELLADIDKKPNLKPQDVIPQTLKALSDIGHAKTSLAVVRRRKFLRVTTQELNALTKSGLWLPDMWMLAKEIWDNQNDKLSPLDKSKAISKIFLKELGIRRKVTSISTQMTRNRHDKEVEEEVLPMSGTRSKRAPERSTRTKMISHDEDLGRCKRPSTITNRQTISLPEVSVTDMNFSAPRKRNLKQVSAACDSPNPTLDHFLGKARASQHGSMDPDPRLGKKIRADTSMQIPQRPVDGPNGTSSQPITILDDDVVTDSPATLPSTPVRLAEETGTSISSRPEFVQAKRHSASGISEKQIVEEVNQKEKEKRGSGMQQMLDSLDRSLMFEEQKRKILQEQLYMGSN